MLTLSIAVATVSVNKFTLSVAVATVNDKHVNTKHCGYNALKLSVVVKTVNDNT